MALFCHNVVFFLHFKIVFIVCQATIEKGTGKSWKEISYFFFGIMLKIVLTLL